MIVGGGLASGLVARQLTAAGLQTLVLERGGDRTGSAAERMPTQRDELRWDIRAGLGQDGAAETYTWRHSDRDASMPVRRLGPFLPGTGVGGAGNHWNGICFRWSEHETELRTHLEERYGRSAIPADMPLQDWGVGYRQLEPYYELFEHLFGVAGIAGNLRGRIISGGNPYEAPRRSEFPQPPLEFTEAGRLFREAAGQLGYRAFPGPAANSPASYTNPDGMTLGACQYCGHCDRFLCEAGAKGTPEVLLYPLLRRRPGFELRTLCQVIGIGHDPAARRVTNVDYIDLTTGETCRQPAEVVVLAAFTLSNAKLLLTGGIGRAYDARAGQGTLGKNFCYQTLSGIDLFFRDRWINPFLAAGGTTMIVDDFNGDNFDHSRLGFLGGGFIGADVVSGRPILSRRLPPGTPRWGTAWKQAGADWYAHAFTLGVQGSCYPNRENHLDLDPDYRDVFGQPLVRITFDIPANEARMSDYCTARAADIARAMTPTAIGPVSGRRSPFDTRVYQTTHVTGGTIMGNDPAVSVVSPRLQHWNAENLFVVGASVFPHNSGHNPTQLIGALALRLGDDLVRYAARPGRLS